MDSFTLDLLISPCTSHAVLIPKAACSDMFLQKGDAFCLLRIQGWKKPLWSTNHTEGLTKDLLSLPWELGKGGGGEGEMAAS